MTGLGDQLPAGVEEKRLGGSGGKGVGGGKVVGGK